MKDQTELIALVKIQVLEKYDMKERCDISFAEKTLKQIERVDFTAHIAEVNELINDKLN